MKYFPLFADLQGRRVVIASDGAGGEAALRKARLLAAAGAEIEIFAPEITDDFRADWSARADLIDHAPTASDFAGAALAIIAVEDDKEAASLAGLAKEAGAPVNAVDRPALSDFIIPSIVDRGDVTVAISTAGAAPILGQRIRAKVEALLPPRLQALADFARKFRAAVAGKVRPSERRGFWERFFDGPIAAQILAGDDARAREAMITAINRPQTEQHEGVVHLVGAGPGDPELLTMKAHRLLREADVIIYDRLVGDGVLDLARRDATRIYVGKSKANHCVPQDKIEDLMIAHARAGENVVRLKGGDPFIFGRGGEELERLRAEGIAVFVTPGVTAAMGCAAAAGMALTHRDHAQAVTFVTGHAKQAGGKEARAPDLDWQALAALKNTLVVYMGVGNAGTIADNMINAGRAASTPVAIIENGTRDNELIVKGQLGDLAGLVERDGVKGPALLVIGEVAAFATPSQQQPVTELERLIA